MVLMAEDADGKLGLVSPGDGWEMGWRYDDFQQRFPPNRN
ncbi:MAG: hypothetical protein R2825_19520 [Saprospiraceae bacterium]